MVIQRIDENWLDGELHGKRGIFPDNYVEVIQEDNAQIIQDVGFDREQPGEQEKLGPRARALYDYQSSDDAELSFHVGDIIMLTQRLDEDWLEGTAHGQTGYLPDNFVEIIEDL